MQTLMSVHRLRLPAMTREIVWMEKVNTHVSVMKDLKEMNVKQVSAMHKNQNYYLSDQLHRIAVFIILFLKSCFFLKCRLLLINFNSLF